MPALAGRVVALADAAEQAGARAGVDDAVCRPVRRAWPVRFVGRGVAGRAEVGLQVDLHHRVPLLPGGHEHAVTEEAGVVDHDVEAAPRVDGGLMRRWLLSQSATSSLLATASPPMARMASTTSPAGPSDPPLPSMLAPMSFTTTLRPGGRTQAWARPMPRPAPSLTTIRPSQRPLTRKVEHILFPRQRCFETAGRSPRVATVRRTTLSWLPWPQPALAVPADRRPGTPARRRPRCPDHDHRPDHHGGADHDHHDGGADDHDGHPTPTTSTAARNPRAPRPRGAPHPEGARRGRPGSSAQTRWWNRLQPEYRPAHSVLGAPSEDDADGA